MAEEVLGDYSAKHLLGYDINYGLPEEIAPIRDNVTRQDTI